MTYNCKIWKDINSYLDPMDYTFFYSIHNQIPVEKLIFPHNIKVLYYLPPAKFFKYYTEHLKEIKKYLKKNIIEYLWNNKKFNFTKQIYVNLNLALQANNLPLFMEF